MLPLHSSKIGFKKAELMRYSVASLYRSELSVSPGPSDGAVDSPSASTQGLWLLVTPPCRARALMRGQAMPPSADTAQLQG